jgi:hypothetical protein
MTTKAPESDSSAGDSAPPRPPDVIAYRIAVGAIGAALVAFLIGAAVIAAGGKPVPTQYWSTGSGIAGALIGLLAPPPIRKTQPLVQSKTGPVKDRAFKVEKFLHEFIVRPVVDLWKNRSLLILTVVFATSLGLSVANNSSQLQTVAAAAGGALVGLLAPPPSK